MSNTPPLCPAKGRKRRAVKGALSTARFLRRAVRAGLVPPGSRAGGRPGPAGSPAASPTRPHHCHCPRYREGSSRPGLILGGSCPAPSFNDPTSQGRERASPVQVQWKLLCAFNSEATFPKSRWYDKSDVQKWKSRLLHLFRVKVKMFSACWGWMIFSVVSFTRHSQGEWTFREVVCGLHCTLNL